MMLGCCPSPRLALATLGLASILACTNQEPAGSGPGPVGPAPEVQAPDSVSLKGLGLKLITSQLMRTFTHAKAISPAFHRDSMKYYAEGVRGNALVLQVTPASPTLAIEVSFEDSILQGHAVPPSSDTLYYSFSLDSSGTVKVKVSSPSGGGSRTYAIAIRIPTPVNTGEWAPLSKLPGSPSTFDFIDAKTGFAKFELFSLHKTTDGGETWLRLPFPLDSLLWNGGRMDFVDGDTGFVCFPEGPLWRTSDGGLHWEEVASRVPFDQFQFLTSRIGYGTFWGELYQTQDGGNTWQDKRIGIGSGNVTFIDATHGFVSGAGGKVWRTRNGGDSWEVISGGLDTNLFLENIYVQDTNTLAVGNWSRVFRTSDGGRTWNALAIPANSGILGLVFTTPETGYMSMNKQGIHYILKTVDGGMNWTNQYVGYTMFYLRFPEPETGYAYSPDGTLMRLRQ